MDMLDMYRPYLQETCGIEDALKVNYPTCTVANLLYPGHVLGTKEHGTTSFLVLATHTPRLLLDLQFAWPYQDHQDHTKTLLD